MPVRGSTAWQHARAEKRVINLDRGGTHVVCAWDECDNDGFQNYRVTTHEHARNIACDSDLARHCTYIFCNERHKQYWLACTGAQAHETAARNGGRIAGMLPEGYRNAV